MDPLETFREKARQGWAHFLPIETFTSQISPRLLRIAAVPAGARLLDVGCGTGVAALVAARAGARSTGVDLTPVLLERARENARLMKLDVDFHEGDVEALPFPDAQFAAVISQFGHMFAPRPEIAVREMLRVLAPGGTLAFVTWPPELYTGRMFNLLARYGPPPPPGIAPPGLWGDIAVVRERLAAGTRDLTFHRDVVRFPALSVTHFRMNMEATIGPMVNLVAALSASDEAQLAAFRAELESLIAEFFEDNTVRQDYLITRAIKSS